MTNREAITKFPNPAYTCAQFSSYDRNSNQVDRPGWFANWDRNQWLRIEQNKGRREFVMMDIDGPGAIVRFWVTAASYNRNGILRIYIDNNEEPVVEGEIFNLISGNSLAPEPLASDQPKLSEYKYRGHNLYLPIPYAKHCKVTYESSAQSSEPGGKSGESLYYAINYRTYKEGTWRKFRNQDGNDLLSQAVSAAGQVLSSSGFELFDRRDVLGDESYKYFFILDKVQANKANLTKSANKEYILAKRFDPDIRPGGWLGANRDPSPTRKFADLFLCTDGLPIDKSSLFEGRSTVSSEYTNRDLRMKNILLTPNQRWWASTPPEFGRKWDNPDGGGVIYDISFSNHTTTGYLTRKFFTEIAAPYGPDVPFIRLAEVMLIYAEALYEKDGQISDADLDKSINKLRARTDLPSLTNAFVNSNGLDMREEIRRERSVELFLEGQRFDDIRRWKTAETEMPMALTGVQYTGTQYENEEPWKSIEFTLDANGNIVVEAASNRRFDNKHYLFPLPTRQILINPQLEQNPGWE